MNEVKVNRADAIEQRLSQIPEKQRGKYKRAASGKSLRAAVDAFCSECMGYVVDEIRECTDPGCPLYPYRRIAGQPCPTRDEISV
jgi:hypothetical protein